MSTTPTTVIGKAIAKVIALFHKVEAIIDVIIDDADKFVNTLKNLEASDAGQFLEIGIEALFPSATDLINAGKLWLPKLAGVILNIKDEENKTDEQKLADLIAYAAHLKANDMVAYTGLLTTLNVAYQQFVTTNKGIAFTIPQSFVASPVNHDENLGVAA